jgi:D-alanyl-D-alanine carboxypeptidase (penicillin-binding protein 5/6)
MCCRRTLVSLVAAVALMVAAVVGAAPVGASPLPTPEADIVVDASTGCMLQGLNVHTRIHPASTAKVMTALVGVERLAPDARVHFSVRDANVELHRIGGLANTSWPLNDVLAGVMMISANDAAYAIADNVGHGNLDAFAADADALGQRLGMRDSTWNDPAGLDDTTSFNGGPYTSAYDLAIATRNALTVPAIAKWAGMYEYQFVDVSGVHHDFVNHNRMLAVGGPYSYSGTTGFKTGYTSQAQHSLIATAQRNGRTLIAVILGAPDAGYPEAAGLLDAGFATPPRPCASGVVLPPARVSLYANRAADRDAFGALGSNGSGSATGGSGPNGAAASDIPAVIPVGVIAPHGAPTVAVTEPAHHSGGLLSLRNVVLVLLALGIVAFFLRRRAVKRQRARRLARRRQRVAAMRSGGLTVIDGRYRLGVRVGPPVESEVSVRRG